MLIAFSERPAEPCPLCLHVWTPVTMAMLGLDYVMSLSPGFVCYEGSNRGKFFMISSERPSTFLRGTVTVVRSG